MSSPPGNQASEEELRAAYEAELSAITTADVILQTAVSLLHLGSRRLGLAAGAEAERDLEQVRDAIDGVRALMELLERRVPQELGPLRQALSQLQIAYARETQAAKEASASQQKPEGEKPAADDKSSSEKAQPSTPGAAKPASQSGESSHPGPAESSGRLWIPGR